MSPSKRATKEGNKKKLLNLEGCGISLDDPDVKDTTLIKHQPYSVIHGDDREGEIDVIIRRLKDSTALPERCDPEDAKQLIRPYLERMVITDADEGQLSVSVAPVLQLISLKICNTKYSHWNLQISGEITMTDHHNNLFYLYKSPTDYQMLDPQHSDLSLAYYSMSPVTRGLVRFCFTTKSDDDDDDKYPLPLFDGVTDLSNSTQLENGFYSLELYGSNGYVAKMLFTKIQHAVLIRIQMTLRHRHSHPRKDEILSTFGVYGNITVNDVVTLCSDSKDCVQMEHGRENDFYETIIVFAVPIGQPVMIKAKLHRDDGRLLFHNNDLSLYPILCLPTGVLESEIHSRDDDSITFILNMTWYRHEDFFSGFEEDLNAIWSSDIFSDKQEPGPLVASESNLVEIFSVILGNSVPSKAKAPLALCGKILVRDAHAENYIFLRNKERSNLLCGQSKNIVSLAWPSSDDGWIVEKDFLMHFKLEDNEGNKVCVGSFEFPRRNSSNTPYDTLYDRGMCDYIQGDDGYFVAVYYSVYKNGKKAGVYIKWKGGDSLVYGSIVAKHGHCSLSTCDEDTKFDTSSIFERSKIDCIKVSENSELPLSKSRVSTSLCCDKISICVNLLHHPIKDPASSIVRKIECDIELEAWRNEKIQDLESIMVKVEWF